ncbi:hypothetical protein [Flavobacterium wongokense]|uniref:hypothetical protein n=1 Tax=Flavobacterium wongokense TaxID=2910674 RepID=UPI001F2FF8A2|nr:hypothetical protein [Flavobacterium sp. WG47]MCF6133554.1 hypothetical protein [Flavobacterium sp. WG47]
MSPGLLSSHLGASAGGLVCGVGIGSTRISKVVMLWQFAGAGVVTTTPRVCTAAMAF